MQQEQKQGTITKVSGPLVVARGMEGAEMYEVVKVSKEKLIGEVIELVGDKASIQVYESTSGIGPGEPVYRTGAPLEVELGPGLLENFYDGIQRPLDALEKKTGAFIARGVEVPGLSRTKKWDFIPKVKKGDRVQEGDILGTIQETTLIEHRVMVPPGVSGTIQEIKKGNFTIEEVIAQIKDKEKVHEVKMYQKWPVRKERPTKEELIPTEPLVSGQRVIDAFFPITKGGTACVPGPFGSGKCVTGDTLVMMGNGKIVSMKDIFKEGKKKGKSIAGEKNEEIYDVAGLGNPSVISLEKKGFKVKEPITVYKGKTLSTVQIKTRTGKEIELTPIHKLSVLGNGEIVQKPAQEVKKGDYLVTPRRTSLGLRDQLVNVLKLLGSSSKLFSCDEALNKKAKIRLKSLLRRKKIKDIKGQYLRKTRKIPLTLLAQAFEKENTKNPKRICSYHGKTITIPPKMLPEFSEFLGYVMADGNLKKNSFSIRFYNAEKEILQRYSTLAERLFSIRPNIYKHPKGNLKIAQIDCKALFDLLVALGFPIKQKAKNAHVPEIVLKSSDESITAFISAYIACDGSVDVKGSRLEINSASRQIIKELSFVFLRLGIVTSIEKQRKDGTSRLWINSSTQLERFSNETKIVGKKGDLLIKAINKKRWSSIDAIPVPSILQHILKKPGILTDLRKRFGIHTERYAYGTQRVGTRTLIKIVNVLSTLIEIPKSLKELTDVLREVFFDEIIQIKYVQGVESVYDVEVPTSHNFIGGHGPLLLSNTVVQHQLAKWADTDVIIFVGAGERGNEMTDVLLEFPELKDPRTGEPLMKRTVLIANTSNMPVAAREASIYTGITMGEYFRDMGYKVALMADSTSRWAEALREISGRLEEMPGEEAYPAYLGSRTAAFYERAGRVKCLGSEKREGSLSVIGAVSPPGGDLSEPVSQNTLRVTKVFWGLDDALASRRHFPAINWLTSYSLYAKEIEPYMKEKVAEDWVELRTKAMAILQQEDSLKEIVRLVGVEALSLKEQLVLDTAKSIREDFLMQNAFDEIDTYTSLKKQYWMLKAILTFHQKGQEALDRGVELKKILTLPIKEKIAKAKFVEEKKMSDLEKLVGEIGKVIEEVKTEK